jgi:hypothetical protein
MSQRILSPNVVFSEVDLTRVRTQRESSPYLVIGTTPMASYFVPTTVRSGAEYDAFFGGTTKNEVTGLAVKDWLNQANSVTVLPVANVVPYTASFSVSLTATVSGDTATLAELYLTQYGVSQGVTDITVGVGGNMDDFDLTFTGTSPVVTLTGLSLFDDDANFIGNYTNPLSKENLFYVRYYVDPKDAFGDPLVSASTVISATKNSNVAHPSYREGQTPWVLSQTFSGQRRNLFRFRTLNQGDMANRMVKVEIANVRTASEAQSTHSVFDVLVRDYTDNETAPRVIEEFRNVNLNPDSPNFVARQIGDSFVSFTAGQVVESGQYDNNSSYIRIELDDVFSLPSTAYPEGFGAYQTAKALFVDFNSASGTNGIKFDSSFSRFIHSELPTNTVPNTSSTPYTLTDFINLQPTDRRFVFGFFGGTNGFDPALPKNVGKSITNTNTFGLSFVDTTSNGYLSYKQALDVCADYEYMDFELAVMAGLNLGLHSAICSYALDIAKTRGDVGFIFSAGTVGTATSSLRVNTTAFNSSYGIAYAGDYYINDASIGNTLVSPDIIVPSAFAYTDSVSAPWFATSGYNRGTVESALRPYTRINVNDRDRLFESRINSVVKVVGESSATILGNRSLNVDPDDTQALSYFNVRRLLNQAKKRIRFEAKGFLEEPFNDQTVARFTQVLESYFQRVQQRNGLNEFRVVFQNTPEAQDSGILRGTIFLSPTRAIRGISIGFVLTATGGINFNE